MSAPELVTAREGRVLTVTFDRPRRRNALTWEMYDGLAAAIDEGERDPEVRALVLRGRGGAFAAGTDIQQFSAFADGADGVRYERRVTQIVNRLESVPLATVAVVDGACTGAGLVLAAACDLRVATPAAVFGVPVARTLGNCLSANSCSLLSARFGPARLIDMIYRARLIDAAEMKAAGFLSELCEPAELDATVRDLLGVLLGHAPLTLSATKATLQRLRLAALPDDDDIIAAVFGSDDFRAGVAAFVTKQRAQWTGR
jgi:enoyl-CoA hydratase/carnithine racemase